MATTITELFDGRTETIGRQPKAEIPYLAMGATDEADVRAAALASIPGTYLDMFLEEIAIDRRINASTWSLKAKYSKPTPNQQETPEPEFSFDTTGGTQHITQSLQTVGAYGDTSDIEGAIGYDGKNVNGVDITVPVYQFTETIHAAPALVTQAYKMTLMELTGTVNNAPFRGFAAGEVLFLGVSSARHGANPDDNWDLSFKFAAAKNKTGISIGSITGIDKGGWEYLWVQYADDVDAAAKTLIKKPIAVYVERVYEYGNFALMGIGA